MKLNYAVILTTDATGITNATYGCVAGVFRFVTGRPGYDGTPTYPKWEDTSNNTAVWYEGMLLIDGIDSMLRQVDLTISGGYGSMSGFNFRIRNDFKIWDFLNDNEIYVINRRVQVYAVLDDVYYSVWDGVVSKTEMTETDYVFECIDRFRTVHKKIPVVAATETSYPDLSEDSTGEPIPVVIGEVARAPLLNISKPVYLTLNIIGGVSYDTSAYNTYESHYGSTTYGLIHTRGVSFSLNELRNKFLFLVGSTEPSQAIRIVGNSATGVTAANKTLVTLVEPIPGMVYPDNCVVTDDSTTDTIWVMIGEMASVQVISENEVSAIGDKVEYYDQNDYIDISSAKVETDLTAANEYQHPYVKLYTDNVDSQGSFKFLYPLEQHLGNSLTITGIQTYTGSFQNVINQRTVYMESPVCTIGHNGFNSYQYVFELIAPTLLGDTVDDSYLLMDFLSGASTTDYFAVEMNIAIKNIFGGQVTKGDGSPLLFSGDAYPPAGYALHSNTYALTLPAMYYGNNSYYSSSFPYAIPFGSLIIDDDFKNAIKTNIYNNRLMVTLNFYKTDSVGTPAAGSFHLDIDWWSIGLVGKEEVQAGANKLFIPCMGEKIDGLDANTVYRAFRVMLETYDGISPTDIDYDNLPETRDDWYIGRALVEQKSSYEYIDELATQSFVTVYPTRTGKRKLSAWRDKQDPIWTFDSTTILRDGIKQYIKTPLSNLYNDFFIEYQWDPGRGKYIRSFFCTHVDETSFPVDDTWKLYCGGLDASSYSDSKILWDICHSSYNINKAISYSPSGALRELPWYTDRRLYNANESEGIGSESSAFKFLQRMVEWTTRQKDLISIRLPISATYMALELCDCCLVSDPIYTNNDSRLGWIVRIELLPAENQIEVEIILEPLDIVSFFDDKIVESGDRSITIVETGDQANTYVEA